MNAWIGKLFIEHADIFLKIFSGNLLDLCCGNGRISICMALKGFKAVGVDISRPFIEDARRKAEEYGVSSLVRFVEGGC